jgi:A118 family predicted phage portal protein
MKLDAFFKTLGYDITESVNWDSKVRQWESWYRGKIASFHNYTIYNGIKDVKMSRKSLQMAKKVCEDWANLLFNEKVTITLGTDADTKKLEDVFNGNNLWQGINQAVEKTFAGGMGAFVVSLNDLSYDENTGLFIVDDKSKLKVDFVSARKIKPLSWDSNGIKECAFASQMYIKGKEHYAISVHKLNDKGNYVIKNYLLEVCGSTYKDITSTVDTLADEFDTQSPVAWFSIYTPNICNNIVIDDLSPFGISVFANAIDTLQSIDIIYDSFANEFMLGRKRIFIAAETMKFDAEGQKFTFDPNDIVFQQLPKDIKSENLVL